MPIQCSHQTKPPIVFQPRSTHVTPWRSPWRFPCITGDRILVGFRCLVLRLVGCGIAGGLIGGIVGWAAGGTTGSPAAPSGMSAWGCPTDPDARSSSLPPVSPISSSGVRGSQGWIISVPSVRRPGIRRGVRGMPSSEPTVVSGMTRSRVAGMILRRCVRVRRSTRPDPSDLTKYCLFSNLSTTTPVRSQRNGCEPTLFCTLTESPTGRGSRWCLSACQTRPT